MDPITMAALFQGVVGGGQLLGGAIGSLTNKRPEKEIPDSLRQSLSLAKAAFLDPKMSGYEQAAESIDLQTANQLQAATQGGRAAEAIAGVAGAQQSAYSQLEAQNQMSKERDRDRLTDELGKMADAEDLAWQMNEFAPFKDKYQQSRDVFGAGIENTFGALDKYGMLKGLLPGGDESIQAPVGTQSTGTQAAPDEIISLFNMLSKGKTAAYAKSIPWELLAKIL